MVKIPVDGSDKIIKKMHSLILSDIDLWKKDQEEKYIKSLSEKIKISTDKLMKDYQLKLSPLQEDQLTDKSFKFLLLLSEVIKEIQIRSTNRIIVQIEKKLESELSKDEITSRLDNLSQHSDVNFSLLINLGILNEYAAIVGSDKKTDVFNEYFEKVIQLLENHKNE